MSSAFRILFGCCFGKDNEDSEERRHLLDPHNGDAVSPTLHTDPAARDDKPRSQEFKQRLDDLVQYGTSQLITRSRVTYSPIFPTASSSNPNIMAPSTSRLPTSAQAGAQQSQPDSSRHSTQSSRHSSFRQHHPSLGPHLETEAGPSEDGTPALERLNPTLSLPSGGVPNYGTLSPAMYGAPAPAAKFQIFKERPKFKSKSSGNNADSSGVKNQVNGVLSSSGPHDEQTPENSVVPVANQTNATGESGKAPEPQRQVHFQLPKGDLILHYDD